jgi:hypothetical protein
MIRTLTIVATAAALLLPGGHSQFLALQETTQMESRRTAVVLTHGDFAGVDTNFSAALMQESQKMMEMNQS